MTTFKRKDNVRRKLESDELAVHTGVRMKQKKVDVRPKPLGSFKRLISVLFGWMGKR